MENNILGDTRPTQEIKPSTTDDVTHKNDSSEADLTEDGTDRGDRDENPTIKSNNGVDENEMEGNVGNEEVAEGKEEEWQDILGSGQLLKKILKKGKSDTRPQRMDVCTVKYVGKLEDKVVDENLVTINVGDAEVIQGLDLALSLMDLEEEAELIIGPRFAFGSEGLKPDIPPNATLHYTVTLISSDPEPLLETLSLEERKEIGNRKKERGNYWYSRNDHTIAIQCYRRALEYLDDNGLSSLESSKQLTDEDLRAFLEERIKVYNNLAAAQLKVKSYDLALQSVDNVLTCQPDNVKALFRKGKILGEKGETEEGISFLKKALSMDPENVQAKNELNNLLIREKKDRDLQRNLYKKMLGTNKTTANTSTSSHSDTSSPKWVFAVGCVGVICSMLAAYRWFKPF